MKESQFKSRETLLKVSLEEFGLNSYEKASLNNIIKNAGVSKGSFYYHFKNKEDLYKHLLQESVAAKWAYIRHYSQENGEDFSGMDMFDKFLYQAKAGIRFAGEYPAYHQLGLMFAKERGTEIYEKLIDIIGGDSSDMLKEMIATAYESGELNTSFKLDFIINVLEKLFQDYDDFFESYEDTKRNLDQLDEFVRFMKEGFGAKS